MIKPITESVFNQIKARTFYRPRDLRAELNLPPSTISKSLNELARGGLVEKIKDGKRSIYITKQEGLF